MERRDFLGGMAAAALVGSPPSTGSAVPTAAAAPGDGRTYDVRAFGALGDGKADDTAAFRRAIQGASEAPGVVFLPPGDYLISETLTLPSAISWVLRGSGRNLSRIRPAPSAKSGELFGCKHSHLRGEFGCAIEDLLIDAGRLPGTPLKLEAHTLFSMRRVTIANATGGSGMVLIGLYDSQFEDVYLEHCGDTEHASVVCRSPASNGGDAMNNCVFINLHTEGATDGTHLDIDGMPHNKTDTLQFFALKCHGDPKTSCPTQPLIRVGPNAISCSFLGGLAAWGKGATQIEIAGQRNRFIGIDHGAGGPSGNPKFAYRLTETADGNHIISPNFKNGVAPNLYASGYVRVEPGANHNKFLFPQMSTGTAPIGRVLDDNGRGTLFLGDDFNDNGGLYVRHGQGFTPLLTNGISGTVTPARNLRGAVTISGDATTSDVRFRAPEPDAAYYLSCTVTGVSGSPKDAAARVHARDKTEHGFVVQCEAPPGPGNVVTVDWMLLR